MASLRLAILFLLIIANPCSAQRTEDQPELSRHAASLTSKSATERGTAILPDK